MKIAGRKTSAAYELYGFIPRVANGKHSAICMACNRILQNTAAVRLERHRNACSARPLLGHPAHFQNFELKTNKVWNKKLVEMLILKYQENENLYNVKNPAYMNPGKRSNSLFAICQELTTVKKDITVEDIKRKIHTLRAQYIKELREIAKSKRSGVGIDLIYKPKLWCFSQLAFLKSHCNIRKSEFKIAETDGSNSSFVVEDESIAKEPEHKAQPIRYKRTDGSNSRFVVEDESIAKEPDHKAQPIHYKRRCYASKVEEVQRDERINLNIKTENNDIGLEDTNLDDDANGNTTSEDAVEATNSSRRLHKYPTNDERNNIYSVLHKSKEPCDTSYQDEYSIQSPVATLQLSPEPFESHHAVTNPASTSGLDIDDENQEVNDEDLINIEEELDALQNLMPRSKESKQLQDELSKAETEYYRCKAAYFTKLTENCSIKKNLMLLESRKLQLEIEKLTKES